jgi:hypothetical protein
VIDRRAFVRYVSSIAAIVAASPRRRSGALPPASAARQPPSATEQASAYGSWVEESGLPCFAYAADHEAMPAAEWDRFVRPPTRRHWLMVGNRWIKLQAGNDGTVGIYDESEGLRWLVSSDEGGTGVSILRDGATTWGSAFTDRPPGAVPRRIFGPTWFAVRCAHRGLELERVILCAEGEVPWVLVRVRLSLATGAEARALSHEETWRLRPRFLNLPESEPRRQEVARAVTYRTAEDRGRITATETFPAPVRGQVGAPSTLVLEALGSDRVETSVDATGEPTLRLVSALELAPGTTRELWFRFGRPASGALEDPSGFFEAQLGSLRAALPKARSSRAPEAEREIPWHAALLTGGACRDRVLGGHTLDQGSAYSFEMGFNGAARDPLQHALPLVYSEPDLALSVLRNVVAWGSPDGDLPYALGSAKQPLPLGFRPSDSNLWSLWLASEYAAASGDLAAFDAEVSFHPSHGAPAVPLREALRRQLRFFVDVVGRGARNHVRILNADWNDLAIAQSGVPAAEMIEHGSSVLNSAMASWVLGVFAGLADRLGETALAEESRQQSSDLRALVRQGHNGRWFHRAYAPDGRPVGDESCWLEVQPWAILCGAADDAQARALLQLIDEGHRRDSPLGARIIWPLPVRPRGTLGEGLDGGIWLSINTTLIWAAARLAPELAWDEWRRMSLRNHARHYPEVWEGTLSGPDAYNAPESPRPGRTWKSQAFAMQAFPVNNLHSHSQPLLAYLRLLGVEPTPNGTLAVGRGGEYSSRVFSLREDGSGRLRSTGEVQLETVRGPVRGRGEVAW